jgi:hypothetical protein
MKKFFTLIAMGILALSAQAAIVVHVESETAPYIWAWGAKDANNADVDLSDLFKAWPGDQVFTGTEIAGDGTEFWTYTFPENVVTVSFLFNDGQAEGTKQTKDFNGVTTDRYFTLTWDDGDGNIVCEDISEAYVDIPDAVIRNVILVGNHNNWGNDIEGEPAPKYEFTEVEEGKTFSITMNMTNISVEDDMWQFKFRPNESEWIGYWDFYYDVEEVEGKVSADEAPEWLQEKGGNFMIDFDEEEGTTERIFTFTITWGGGKEAGANWTLNAEIADPAGINTLKANSDKANAIFNLQGQRVAKNYRGIAIQNGKKIVVK